MPACARRSRSVANSRLPSQRRWEDAHIWRKNLNCENLTVVRSGTHIQAGCDGRMADATSAMASTKTPNDEPVRCLWCVVGSRKRAATYARGSVGCVPVCAGRGGANVGDAHAERLRQLPGVTKARPLLAPPQGDVAACCPRTRALQTDSLETPAQCSCTRAAGCHGERLTARRTSSPRRWSQCTRSSTRSSRSGDSWIRCA